MPSTLTTRPFQEPGTAPRGGSRQQREYVPFYFCDCPKACGVRDVDNEEQLNKQDGIVNKSFVEMLDKLGYDIQITYVKKETN